MSSKILRRIKLLNAAGTITVLGLGTWAAKSLLICEEAYAESPTQPPQKIFSRFFGQSLRLENSENVNHNTKRLRFAFPNPEAQSGLTLTCIYPHLHHILTGVH
jgi:cytochrome-b5 reductase